MRKVNKVVSYRKWVPFWGLFLDQHKEIDRMVGYYNDYGWHVVQFDWTSEKFSILRWLLIILVSAVTLGFMVYWSGAIIIFEKEV